MQIYITNVFVEDQSRALDFYAGKLGFQVKYDIPCGAHRWLTLVSPEDPEGPELLLEPAAHRAVAPYKTALYADGIPAASFKVKDIDAEYARLKSLGVAFTMHPTEMGPARVAVLDDDNGNLIQLVAL